MLSLLHIENIALIDRADISFERGFNVLTGETGAGKSIIIDSIGAIMGERTSRDLIRTGAKSARVTAVFRDLPPLQWFETSGIAPDENGELLLEQLLGEREFDLQDAGFETRRIGQTGSCTLMVDPLYLKRVLDNMLSNIKKYADKAQPVLLLIERSEEEVRVSISNTIARSMDGAESTKIGLRTCEKILGLLGGSFQALREDGKFSAGFCLPVQPGSPEEDAEQS